MIQLRLDKGPAHYETRAGAGFPLRVFRAGKVTIIDGPNAAEEARRLCDAMRKRNANWRVLELSESGIFAVHFDCGVPAPADFRQQLSGLLVGQDGEFRMAFVDLLAAGTAALAGTPGKELDESEDDDEPELGETPLLSPEDLAGKDAVIEKIEKKPKKKGAALTSADIPKVEV